MWKSWKQFSLVDDRPQTTGLGVRVRGAEREAEGPPEARPPRDLQPMVRSLEFKGTGEPWMVLSREGQD